MNTNTNTLDIRISQSSYYTAYISELKSGNKLMASYYQSDILDLAARLLIDTESTLRILQDDFIRFSNRKIKTNRAYIDVIRELELA